MATKVNPYRPDKIARGFIFAGRAVELEHMRTALEQARVQNSGHFLILGERGIGKSSLLAQAADIANDGFDFLIVQLSMTDKDDFVSIISRLSSELGRAVEWRTEFQVQVKKVLDLISRVEAFGVKLRDKAHPVAEDSDILHTFIEALRAAVDTCAPDGVLILIDEADKPSVDAGLGMMIKSITERLTISGHDCVVFGLAGLTEVKKRLVESHESSLRILDLLPLEPLAEDECREVVVAGLDEASALYGQAIRISGGALDSLARLSEGHPHYLQQYAHSAFQADTDDFIDECDVRKGAEAEDGALAQLGEKYFRPIYEHRIRSDNYRLVLRSMAYQPDRWVAKARLRELTGLEEGDLANAIRTLCERDLLVRRAGVAGSYRLHSFSLQAWILKYTEPLPGEPTFSDEGGVAGPPLAESTAIAAALEYISTWESVTVGELCAQLSSKFTRAQCEAAVRELTRRGRVYMPDTTAWVDTASVECFAPEDDTLYDAPHDVVMGSPLD